MSLSQRTKNALADALTSTAAAKEIVAALAADGTATPSYTSLATTGDITCGGNVKIASGKGLEVNSIQVVGAQQAAPTNVAVTFTTNTPATYGTPAGTLTIADGGTPTVVELVKYCDELRGVIAHILTVLHTHGLTT